jgi:hypothetical protein
MHQALVQELTYHLIDQHMTYSIEDCKPPTLRPVSCQVLLNTLLDYMIGAGYASPYKSN